MRSHALSSQDICVAYQAAQRLFQVEVYNGAQMTGRHAASRLSDFSRA